MESRRVPLQQKSSPTILEVICSDHRCSSPGAPCFPPKKTWQSFECMLHTHTKKKTPKKSPKKGIPPKNKTLNILFLFGLRCSCSLVYLKINIFSLKKLIATVGRKDMFQGFLTGEEMFELRRNEFVEVSRVFMDLHNYW